MTNDRPIEPSAIYAADGTRVPYREEPSPVVPRSLLPALLRVATAGPFLTASAVLLTSAAAARAAEAAARMLRQATGAPVESHWGRRTVPGGLEVSWTHVEIRWPG